MAVKKTTASIRKPKVSRGPTTAGHNGVISTIEWFGILVVLVVPILGIVLYFIWAFGGGNPNRRNYCRAALILMAISIVLGILFSVAFTGIIRMATEGFSGLW